MVDFLMPLRLRTTFDSSSTEWVSMIRRLLLFPVLTLLVDVTLTDLDLMDLGSSLLLPSATSTSGYCELYHHSSERKTDLQG
jgi:hypothetical protein